MADEVRTSAMPGIERAIIEAAFELIAADGFDAMSMRALAKSVGLHPGSLYYHFPSKHDLLGDLLSELLQARLDEWRTAKPGCDDPLLMLMAFIEFHIERHRSCSREERLLSLEMRKLEGAFLKRSEAINGEYFAELANVLSIGAARKVFQVPDLDLVTRSLLAMLGGTGVDDTDAHTRLLTHLALRMLGVEDKIENFK